jgi:hypothetical protein
MGGIGKRKHARGGRYAQDTCKPAWANQHGQTSLPMPPGKSRLG